MVAAVAARVYLLVRTGRPVVAVVAGFGCLCFRLKRFENVLRAEEVDEERAGSDWVLLRDVMLFWREVVGEEGRERTNEV